MIELRGEKLVFSFPDVHPDAACEVGFQRTLRIPDDGVEYPLPAGLGFFPLRHVDDHAESVPPSWLTRGGVILPMHQAEALWISFSGDYPVAVKVAAGRINAITGKRWKLSLHGPREAPRSYGPAPRKQDYVVLPNQPWLDGFNVGEGRIRQFVAMPLGAGVTAEEQITGRGEVGGLQLVAYPMKAARWVELQKQREARWAVIPDAFTFAAPPMPMAEAGAAMGLGLGGLMRQDIEADPFGRDAWDTERPARCFIHLANALQWEAITGEPIPTEPISRAEYERHAVPWFDYSVPGPKVPGSKILAELETVAVLERAAGRAFEDGPIAIDRVTRIPPPAPGPAAPAVREDSTL